jgi:hypothetical protein
MIGLHPPVLIQDWAEKVKRSMIAVLQRSTHPMKKWLRRLIVGAGILVVTLVFLVLMESHRSFPQHRGTLARAGVDSGRALQPAHGAGFEIVELQADELYTFIGNKSRSTWLFVTIEVCSLVGE